MKFVFRVLTRRPLIPLMVATLFALGIGMASGMWAVIDAALLRPLPYVDASKLVAILEDHPQRGLMAVAPANFLDWQHQVKSLEAVAGEIAIDANVAGTRDAERVTGAKVTQSFFTVWGVPPGVGRTLQADDFAAGHRVAVISHGLALRQFGAVDPAVLGSTIRLDGEGYLVVGVMPAEFRLVGNPDLWIPWNVSVEERGERRFHHVGVVARLREGQQPGAAQSELSLIYQQLQREHAPTTKEWSARVMPLRDLLLGDSGQALTVLGVAVVVVVIVACINIASLLLAWLLGRRHELIVRLAVGASVARIVRQIVAETLVCATLGLIGGVAIARWFVDLFGAVAISPTLPFDFEPRLDVRVVASMSAFLVVVAAATALGPSLVAVRRSTDLTPRRGRSSGIVRRRLSVAMQTALSMMLLSAAAGLLVAFQRLSVMADALGEDAMITTEVALPESWSADDVRTQTFFTRLLASLEGRPEVRAVGAASYVPPDRPLGNVRFTIEGRSTSSDNNTALASAVSATAFRLLHTRLISGRLLSRSDGPGAPPVAVISVALARRYWPDEQPIGRRISLVGIDSPTTIVGVVADVRQPLSKDPRAESVLYLPYQQVPWPFMTVIVDPAGDPALAATAIRDELRRLDPTIAAGPLRSLVQVRTAWLGQPRLQTAIVTLFGLATLMLTVVGLYARVAHSVTMRAREFAIRQAVGARPVDVVRSLTLDALGTLLIGVILGCCLLPMSTGALHGLLTNYPSFDPRVILIAAAVLTLSGTASAYWPARRAGRIDPATVLRSD